LSDLASSCEYLTSEKLCLSVSESEKARSSRQVRCKNSEKMTCCYLCMFVLDCATPCRFLETTENEPQPIEAEKIQISNTLISDHKPEEDKIQNAPGICCSLCNAEMVQTRTKLKIDGWERTNQKFVDNYSARFGEETLSVIVYLCPNCGKIDLKVDEKTNTD